MISQIGVVSYIFYQTRHSAILALFSTLNLFFGGMKLEFITNQPKSQRYKIIHGTLPKCLNAKVEKTSNWLRAVTKSWCCSTPFLDRAWVH